GLTPFCREGYVALSTKLREAFVKLTSGLRELRVGEGHGESIADAVGVVVERDVGVMQGGDFADDRQTQAAAVGMAAEEPVEALEDALALLDRYARPVVADRHARPRMREHAHGDAPAAAAVADRVVEQVVDELGEPQRISLHGDVRLGALESEVDVLLVG